MVLWLRRPGLSTLRRGFRCAKVYGCDTHQYSAWAKGRKEEEYNSEIHYSSLDTGGQQPINLTLNFETAAITMNWMQVEGSLYLPNLVLQTLLLDASKFWKLLLTFQIRRTCIYRISFFKDVWLNLFLFIFNVWKQLLDVLLAALRFILTFLFLSFWLLLEFLFLYIKSMNKLEGVPVCVPANGCVRPL